MTVQAQSWRFVCPWLQDQPGLQACHCSHGPRVASQPRRPSTVLATRTRPPFRICPWQGFLQSKFSDPTGRRWNMIGFVPLEYFNLILTCTEVRCGQRIPQCFPSYVYQIRPGFSFHSHSNAIEHLETCHCRGCMRADHLFGHTDIAIASNLINRQGCAAPAKYRRKEPLEPAGN